MSLTIGDTSHWDDFFQNDFVPSVLLHIIAAWEQMAKPGPSDLEDAISNKLYAALVNAKNRSNLPFLVFRENLEFDLDLEKETGRKDIVFHPSNCNREEIYFCLEAKRLNAIVSDKWRSLADEYVKDGMRRFVDRQYSHAVRHGAMLAYVLDGKIDRAMQNVEKNIRKRSAELRMSRDGGFIASAIRPDDNRTKETHHRRSRERAVFRIHHLFVAR